MRHAGSMALCIDKITGSRERNPMGNCLKVGILGAGNIAGSMAEALNELQKEGKACAYAVASRSQEKALEFARKWNITRAYSSYEELASDPEVDLIYIATPHSLHYEQAKVFITEAIWTRYMPSREIITGLLREGVIGTPQILEAEFSVQNYENPRMHDPMLCGGALLDLGVYVLTTASMYFGDHIVKTQSFCEKYPTGVDAADEIQLTYADGSAAQLRCSMVDKKKNCVKICGTKGYISWESNNNPRNLELHGPGGMLIRKITIPTQINGYEYEVLVCREAIRNGQRECEKMPHAETLTIMKQMDELRAQWGVKYPYDE